MKDVASHEPALCTRFHHASELIGRRWNGAIIYVLLQQTCRFATLRDAIPGITDRMLEQGLLLETRERPAPEEDDERRRYYRITPLGTAVAKAEARRLTQLVRMARARGFVPGRA